MQRATFSTTAKPPMFSRFGLFYSVLMNESLLSYPKETLVCVVGLEMCSLLGIYLLLSFLSSLPSFPSTLISVDFALAFAISRPLRKVRFPVEVFFTGVFAKVFPSLTLVKVSHLAKIFPSFQTASKGTGREAGMGMRWMKQMSGQLKTIIDKYGMAYFVASRYVGVAVVLGLWVSLKNVVGLRVAIENSSFYQYLGHGNVSEDKMGEKEPQTNQSKAMSRVGDLLGIWAASVTLNGILYPFTIIGGGLLGRQLGIARRGYFAAKP